MEATAMKKILILLIVFVSLQSGCASLEDHKYRSVNRQRAAEAWKQARACMPASCATTDFAFGFKEGYFAVATGGSSCPPIVPPPCYFHAKYQSTAGQCKVNQWYQGYQAGTIAADKHGRSLWATVPTQDGPGASCPEVELTADTYWSSVIANPSVSETP